MNETNNELPQVREVTGWEIVARVMIQVFSIIAGLTMMFLVIVLFVEFGVHENPDVVATGEDDLGVGLEVVGAIFIGFVVSLPVGWITTRLISKYLPKQIYGD